MITRELVRGGLVRGEQWGKSWEFWAPEDALGELAEAAPGSEHQSAYQHAEDQTLAALHRHVMSADQFEQVARQVLSQHYHTQLQAQRIPGCPKIFDFVSADYRIIGDAKYFTLVQGERTPPAKFSIIAEHVWLLEKTSAERKFLVFGNDRRVPEQWLARYGALVETVQFYFLDHQGELDPLNWADLDYRNRGANL